MFARWTSCLRVKIHYYLLFITELLCWGRLSVFLLISESYPDSGRSSTFRRMCPLPSIAVFASWGSYFCQGTPGGRAGLNEREAPGKVVTARPLKRLTQLNSVSHTLVSTLRKYRLKTSKVIRFGSLHFRDNWGDHLRQFVCASKLICSNMQLWDCSSLLSAHLTAEEGCKTSERIVLLWVFVA